MKHLSLTIILSVFFFSCNSSAQKNKDEKPEVFKVVKTDAEWKAQLNDSEYKVLRHAATEPAFSSSLNDNHNIGTFVCAACGTPVFESENKFDSGTGWPSFDRAIKGNVSYSTDRKLGYTRILKNIAQFVAGI